MLTACIYGKDSFDRKDLARLEEMIWPEHQSVWLDFDGLPAEEEISLLASRLSIHPLAVKNLFDDNTHPRLMEFTGQLYLGVTGAVRGEDGGIEPRHIGFFLGSGYLISAHAAPTAIIDSTRSRLESNVSGAKELGTDFLLYLALDSLIDDYYGMVDQMAEEIDEIDSRAGEAYDKHLQQDVLSCKRRLLILHKAITPLRDILLNLRRTNNQILSANTEVYLRDIFEHILQLLDTIDTYREVLSNTTELAMAAASNRMNEVMTVLTVVTSFFIPLNFIVGYFGMNLIMPEAEKSVTYPIVIVVMLLTVGSMLAWFKKKKWL